MENAEKLLTEVASFIETEKYDANSWNSIKAKTFHKAC
jgi:hypothetical protein